MQANKGQTQMVAAAPKQQIKLHVEVPKCGTEPTVKVEALRAIRVQRPHPDTKKPVDYIITPGNTADLTATEAVEFCDNKFEGVYNFSGERYGDDAQKHQIVRAKRV